jgi:hypothetical protein
MARGAATGHEGRAAGGAQVGVRSDGSDERVLPKAYVEDYNKNYSGHEGDFLLAAREHGLDSKLVGELRDAGIRIAIEAEGRPLSEETSGAMEKRFAGRLTAGQFKALKAWWRGSIEKGA